MVGLLEVELKFRKILLIMKINCNLAAKELCWEKEGMVLIKEIEKIME